MRRVKSQQPQSVILYFFLHAQGETLEKSFNGLYRTLLKQILSVNIIWPTQILDEFRQNQQSNTWYSRKLSAFFRLALLQYARTFKPRLVYIFIDALDEYDSRDSLNDTVRFFENLAEEVWRTAPSCSLNIFFSCRHSPNLPGKQHFPVLPERRLERCLELFNSGDIRAYIQETLHWPSQFQEILIQRADGVFLWVNLVIKELNMTQGDHLTERNVHNILNQIPPELEGLYQRALVKLRRHLFDDSQRLFQWVLFADRSISPAWLAYALAFNTSFDSLQDCEVSSEFFGEAKFESRVLLLSCGLMQYSRSTRRKLQPLVTHSPPPVWDRGRVEFIHESVRTWLCSTKAKHLLQLSPPPRTINFRSWEQKSSQVRKKACSNYLATSDLAGGIQLLKIPREHKPKDWLNRVGNLCTKHAVFEYAVDTIYGRDFLPIRTRPIDSNEIRPGWKLELKIPAGEKVAIELNGNLLLRF